MIVDATQLNALTVTLSGATGRVGARAARLIRQTALDIEGDAKVNAPKVTGTLARSIHTEIQADGRFASMSAEIGTNVAYARRIEYGFVGADKLGRVYDQAPQPYMRPAFERHVPAYVAGMRDIAGDSVLGT